MIITEQQYQLPEGIERRQKPVPERAGEPIMELLAGLSNLLALPPTKQQMRGLSQSLAFATASAPFRVYVGSCPDYSHAEGLYTHEALGTGVPLLSQRHLQVAERVIPILKTHQVPYVYTIMVADVEATDPVFCNQFTAGSEEEFRERCAASVETTQACIDESGINTDSSGTLRSSSFFTEFGEGGFMHLQAEYIALLQEASRRDSSLRIRLDYDISSRMGMYRKMYGKLLESLSPAEIQEFLTYRTIRTMAQYLTLGRFISEQQFSVIINHPTRNIGVFNDRNKHKLSEDGAQPQPTIPVLEMVNKVY